MPVTVTLNIFTGAHNPVWHLEEDQIERLRRKILGKNRTTVQRPKSVFGVLGFGGFEVLTFDEADLPPKFHIGEDIVDFGDFGHGLVIEGGEDMQLEWVKREFGKDKGSFGQLLVRDVNEDSERRKMGMESAPAPVEVAFKHDNPWNFDEFTRTRNNCYNYATNKMMNSYSQPGRYRFQYLNLPLEPLHTVDVEEVEGADEELLAKKALRSVTNKALNDGLVLLEEKSNSELNSIDLKEGEHIVALFLSKLSEHGYHWYRRDARNAWSHKMGAKLVRNTDESGDLITDPRAADRGNYEHFGGFFLVNKDKVTVI